MWMLGAVCETRIRKICQISAVVAGIALVSSAVVPSLPLLLWVHAGRTISVMGLLGLAFLYLLCMRGLRRAYGSDGIQKNAAKMENRDSSDLSFLSIATHEIKGPLTSITLHSQSLLRSCERLANSSQAGQLELRKCARQAAVIERQAARMARLADELLDVGRLERQQLEVQPRPTDLVSLSRAAVAQVQATSSLHRVHLECSETRLALSLDAGRIEQVLLNLLGNAVKYSPEGHEVELRIEARRDEVLCSVKDQGMGIPSEDQNQLFTRFFRARNAREAGIVGFGLGLYICREIVVRHGGKMWLSSEPGKGSTFCFSLPLRPRSESILFRQVSAIHV